mgnify:CR=1 FL=1
MIGRLRERSPRGHIARRGLLASAVAGMLWLAALVLLMMAIALKQPWLVALGLALWATTWLPVFWPTCPQCRFRFRSVLQHVAMTEPGPARAYRYCPHCGLDLASPGSAP